MKKKIVFVIESLHLGGAEKSLVTLLNNLDFNNYEITLLLFNRGGIFLEFVPKQVKVVVMTFPQLLFLERIQYAILRKFSRNQHNAQLFWPLIKDKFTQLSEKYDIAVAYNQGLATYFVSSFVQAKKKYSWLNTDYQKAGYNISFDAPFYQEFDKIIAVSAQAKKSIEEEFSKINIKQSIDIIKDIVDVESIKKQAEQPLKTKFDKINVIIVSVGRLNKQKGFHLAIEACKNLVEKNYNINWYIIGEGSERKNLEKQIHDEGLEKHFYLLGADSNPYPYMKAADVYVQTSFFEGLGLTVIEASLLNKPIVSTNFPTIYDIIEHEKTGLIVNMDATEISSQIERLLIDEVLKLKLIKNLVQQESKDKEISLQKIKELFSK